MLPYLIYLLVLLTGCHPPHSLYRVERWIMHVPLCVQIPLPLSSAEKEQIDSLIIQVFDEVDRHYNHFNPQSEVSRFNRLPAGKPLWMSPELTEFVSQISFYVQASGGRFDPTVGPLVRCWLPHLKRGELPNPEVLDLISKGVGWHHIHQQGRMLWKDVDSTTLDMSGIAKGWAVDRLVARLEELGYDSFYVDWGGEIATRGAHPSGRPWLIQIRGGATLHLHNQAIATSGTYEQLWEVDDTPYSHVFDPRTFQPLSPQKGHDLVSASILAPSCMEADVWAKVFLLCASKKEAEEWQRQHCPQLEIFLIERKDFYTN